jgi:hypothetical protein
VASRHPFRPFFPPERPSLLASAWAFARSPASAIPGRALAVRRAEIIRRWHVTTELLSTGIRNYCKIAPQLTNVQENANQNIVYTWRAGPSDATGRSNLANCAWPLVLEYSHPPVQEMAWLPQNTESPRSLFAPPDLAHAHLLPTD